MKLAFSAGPSAEITPTIIAKSRATMGQCALAIEPLYILAQDVALVDCGTAIDDYG
jgi:hypothetical protein